MEKYRIIYTGDGKYLGWDAVAKRFVPMVMFLYVSTWENLADAMKECRSARNRCSGWVDNIYIDKIERDPHGEKRPG